MADQGADATTAQALIEKWRNEPKVFTGTGIPLPTDTSPERESDASRIRRAAKAECADELEAALAVSPQLRELSCGCAVESVAEDVTMRFCETHRGEAVQRAGARALESILAQQEAVSPQGWEPISSAPKDKRIILGSAMETWESYWLPTFNEWAGNMKAYKHQPIAWMPLPSPPRVAAGPKSP